MQLGFYTRICKGRRKPAAFAGSHFLGRGDGKFTFCLRVLAKYHLEKVVGDKEVITQLKEKTYVDKVMRLVKDEKEAERFMSKSTQFNFHFAISILISNSVTKTLRFYISTAK